MTAPAQLPYGTPGPSIQAFSRSKAFIRVLIGGRGSGKTAALAEDITGHLWNNAGGKAIVARETEASQSDSSIDTFIAYFATLGDLYSTGSKVGLFKSWNNGRSIRVPSRLAIERLNEARPKLTSPALLAEWIDAEGDKLCGYIEFRGLPAAEKGKFRGMECSYLALVEADQIVRRQFEISLACLRWKGVDPKTCDEKGFIKDRCVVLDTNPPGTKHWIAQFEEEEKQKPKGDRVARFWHIPTYENEHNLPENYIRDTILLPYADNSAMIERMLWGRYADAFDGKPVYYSYRRDRHTASGLGWPRGALMIVGLDVGTTCASVISAFFKRGEHLYWWVMREIILRDSDTERQALELLRVLSEDYKFWNKGDAACPHCFFFVDPAAANSNFSSGPTSNSVKILQSHGIHARPTMPTRGLQPSIAIVNRMMQQRHETSDGETVSTVWRFKIDGARCPELESALAGRYRYPREGEPGFGNDQPLKGTLCQGADHGADALRYACVNALTLSIELHTPGMTSRQIPPKDMEPKRRI